MLITESVQAKSMNFSNQRKVIILRDQGEGWEEIAGQVWNCERPRQHPSLWLVRETYNKFNRRAGRRPYFYKNCGRKVTKFTPEVKKFLVKRLLQLRKQNIVTATTLQRELAREKHVEVEASGIRKVLKENGYSWRPRSQKQKYSPQVQAARWAFAKAVLRMSKAQLRERLSLSLDGVVYSDTLYMEACFPVDALGLIE